MLIRLNWLWWGHAWLINKINAETSLKLKPVKQFAYFWASDDVIRIHLNQHF